SADAPGVGVGLRILRDSMCFDGDLGRSRGYVVPHHLLDVVLTVKSTGRPHVSVPLLAVRRVHTQIEVVLQLRAYRVTPHERDLERDATARSSRNTTRTTPARCVSSVAGRMLGDRDGERVCFTLLQGSSLAEACVRIGTRNDHRAGEVYAAKS